MDTPQQILESDGKPQPPPLRMITIRLPKEDHAELREEALRIGVSLNILCRAKLAQVLHP